MSEITITGRNYEIMARELNDGTWAVQGYYDEFEIDSLWTEFELPTFEDADDAILAFLSDEA